MLLLAGRPAAAGGRPARRDRRTSCPDERFEPDAGPDPDVDALRDGAGQPARGRSTSTPRSSTRYCRRSRGLRVRLSDDIADVAGDLAHGLRHYRAGRVGEALWWWQFSYLSNWGQQALSALRALLSIVAHVSGSTPTRRRSSLPRPTRSCATRHPADATARASALPSEACSSWSCPGGTALLIPRLLTGWEVQGGGLGGRARVSGSLCLAGAVVLLQAFARFVVEGVGRRPVAPTDRLVVGGAYRYVRNPMYLAVSR